MANTNLLRYLPDFLKSYVELQAITDAENKEVDDIKARVQAVLENCSVQTCDTERLQYYEKLFGSLTPSGSNISRRRFYLKSALFIRCTPLTEKFLSEWLSFEYWGCATYTIDYENHSLSITTNTPLDFNLTGFENRLRELIPANMLLSVTHIHSHEKLSGYTHEQLSAYTHGDLGGKEL